MNVGIRTSKDSPVAGPAPVARGGVGDRIALRLRPRSVIRDAGVVPHHLPHVGGLRCGSRGRAGGPRRALRRRRGSPGGRPPAPGQRADHRQPRPEPSPRFSPGRSGRTAPRRRRGAVSASSTDSSDPPFAAAGVERHRHARPRMSSHCDQGGRIGHASWSRPRAPRAGIAAYVVSALRASASNRRRRRRRMSRRSIPAAPATSRRRRGAMRKRSSTASPCPGSARRPVEPRVGRARPRPLRVAPPVPAGRCEGVAARGYVGAEAPSPAASSSSARSRPPARRAAATRLRGALASPAPLLLRRSSAGVNTSQPRHPSPPSGRRRRRVALAGGARPARRSSPLRSRRRSAPAELVMSAPEHHRQDARDGQSAGEEAPGGWRRGHGRRRTPTPARSGRG